MAKSNTHFYLSVCLLLCIYTQVGSVAPRRTPRRHGKSRVDIKTSEVAVACACAREGEGEGERGRRPATGRAHAHVEAAETHRSI